MCIKMMQKFVEIAINAYFYDFFLDGNRLVRYTYFEKKNKCCGNMEVYNEKMISAATDHIQFNG